MAPHLSRTGAGPARVRVIFSRIWARCWGFGIAHMGDLHADPLPPAYIWGLGGNRCQPWGAGGRTAGSRVCGSQPTRGLSRPTRYTPPPTPGLTRPPALD